MEEDVGRARQEPGKNTIAGDALWGRASGPGAPAVVLPRTAEDWPECPGCHSYADVELVVRLVSVPEGKGPKFKRIMLWRCPNCGSSLDHPLPEPFKRGRQAALAESAEALGNMASRVSAVRGIVDSPDAEKELRVAIAALHAASAVVARDRAESMGTCHLVWIPAPHFGAFLERARIRVHLSLRAAGDAAGCSHTHLRELETGRAAIPSDLTKLRRLARALEVPAAAVLTSAGARMVSASNLDPVPESFVVEPSEESWRKNLGTEDE